MKRLNGLASALNIVKDFGYFHIIFDTQEGEFSARECKDGQCLLDMDIEMGFVDITEKCVNNGRKVNYSNCRMYAMQCITECEKVDHACTEPETFEYTEVDNDETSSLIISEVDNVAQEIEEMDPPSLIELYNILKLHLEAYNNIANKGCEIKSYKERLIAADRKVRCYNLMNKIENNLIIDPNNYGNLENMTKLEVYDLESKVEFTISILKSRGCGEDIINPYKELALDIKYI